MTKLTSQTARFVRVFLFAVVPSALTLATGQSAITVAAVAACVTPALEVAWRAIHPTVPAATTTPPPTVTNGGAPEPWRPV